MSVVFPLPPPPVMCDTGKIREVISNFIDNAIKYTPEGTEGKIHTKLSQEGNNVRVTVEDNGMGLDIITISHLFQKFSRGKGTGVMHTEGTGLGLYVGRKFIEAHDGKIWAESDGFGKGSRFIFEIPIAGPTNVPTNHLTQPMVEVKEKKESEKIVVSGERKEG